MDEKVLRPPEALMRTGQSAMGDVTEGTGVADPSSTVERRDFLKLCGSGLVSGLAVLAVGSQLNGSAAHSAPSTGWLSYWGLSQQAFSVDVGTWERRSGPSIIVLHSTEGSSYPTYGGGSSAPHFTVDVRKRTARQHFSVDGPSRALVRPSNSLPTNTAGAVQIEIIGSCDQAVINRGVPSVLNLDDEALGYLAGLLQLISARTSIPLTSTVTWKPYPSSYGPNNGVRLTADQWLSYRGVLGHQHVPGNDHGDPGNLDITRLLQPPVVPKVPEAGGPTLPVSDGKRLSSLDPVTYKNGSTRETTYRTVFDANSQSSSVGYLDPYESARCYGIVGGKYLLTYSASSTRKTGLVNWHGGAGGATTTGALYKNGSTSEPVYATVADALARRSSVGSLDPYESAACFGEEDGVYLVAYLVTGTSNMKVGFVRYAGGVV